MAALLENLGTHSEIGAALIEIRVDRDIADVVDEEVANDSRDGQLGEGNE